MICKKQIKKGKSGTRELLQLFKDGYSIALMIDQRVSEGIKSKLFKRSCAYYNYTCTTSKESMELMAVFQFIYEKERKKFYFKNVCK